MKNTIMFISERIFDDIMALGYVDTMVLASVLTPVEDVDDENLEFHELMLTKGSEMLYQVVDRIEKFDKTLKPGEKELVNMEMRQTVYEKSMEMSQMMKMSWN